MQETEETVLFADGPLAGEEMRVKLSPYCRRLKAFGPPPLLPLDRKDIAPGSLLEGPKEYTYEEREDFSGIFYRVG